MTRAWPPKTCHTCGLQLFSLKAKIRHQNTNECEERMAQKRRDAAAGAMDTPTQWSRQ